MYSLSVLVSLYFIVNPMQTHKYKLEKRRSTSAIKSGTLILKTDKEPKPHKNYKSAYKALFDINFDIAIAGRVKQKQVHYIPSEFFDYDFLEDKMGDGVVRYPDFSFKIKYKVNDCFKVEVTQFKVKDVKDPNMQFLICPSDRDLGLEKIDIKGKYKGKFFFKAGFDRR